MLAAEVAFEHGIDTGDQTEFHKARQALIDYRAANAEYDKVNFAGLKGNERTWAKADR